MLLRNGLRVCGLETGCGTLGNCSELPQHEKCHPGIARDNRKRAASSKLIM
jgi:hypothetical protein